MSNTIKLPSKDTTRIGEQSAKQPLSGTSIVTDMRVKGFNGSTFVHIEAIKKSA